MGLEQRNLAAARKSRSYISQLADGEKITPEPAEQTFTRRWGILEIPGESLRSWLTTSGKESLKRI